MARTATLLREGLLHARLHHRGILTPALRNFPFGAGHATSTLLAWTLRTQGRLAELFTFHAQDSCTGEPFTHTWVYTAPFHVDLTGDQYSP